jgi:hypothetical protein
MPERNYRYGEWKQAKLHPDCHIQLELNFYSAPYDLRGKVMDVRVSQSLVEIFYDLDRVAVHSRAIGNTRGRYFTMKEHLPPAHVAMLDATPQMLLEQAEDIGPATKSIVDQLINGADHPLTYMRRVQGILRLGKRYSKPALERARGKVQGIGVENPKLKDIEAIITSNLSPNSADIIPMRKKPNQFLRGQSNWSTAADNTSTEDNL